MNIVLDLNSTDDYRLFLKIKSLPRYEFRGREAIVPDEYAHLLGQKVRKQRIGSYDPKPFLFDYQKAIAALAIRKKKFCIFADCGLGKTPVMFEYARHVAAHLPRCRCILIVSPLMVIPQSLGEAKRFYGDEIEIEQVRAANLNEWLAGGAARIGITNYEAIKGDIEPGRLGCLILDESSMLKSSYGKWGTKLIDMGRGLEWKLALTGTPAPNDRIEYGNHAVFMDAYPTLNSFLARFFVNRGQTQERWSIKPHALRPFYKALSHWCIFLTNPATYGWKDNTATIPPINVHIHHVELTDEQQELVYSKTGTLYADKIGGITSRSVLSQISKGNHKGKRIATHKYEFIRSLVDSWTRPADADATDSGPESTIIWCCYNAEQDRLDETFPDAASIRGATNYEARIGLVDDFKAARRRVLISKPEIMGFGLNLQVCTRMVFSGLEDSFESYYQAVKRANRIGSTKPLNVHIPVTDVERPQIETVLAKAQRVQHDTEEQEAIFNETCAGIHKELNCAVA